MTRKEKLWTKDFVMISVSNFLLFASFYILLVTLTTYSIEQFNASGSIAGLTSSIFVLGAVVVRPIAGNLIETVGRKRLLVFGLLLFVVFTLLYFPVESIGWMLVIRFIHGFAFGISSTATGTIVVDVIPPSRRGEGMGYFATSNNLAMAIGPFIGLMTLQNFSNDAIFVLTAISSAIALVSSFLIKIPEEQEEVPKTKKKRKFHIHDFFEPKVYPIATLMLVLGIANSSILSFISTYAVEINLVNASSYFFMMYAVFLVLSRPFTGRLYDLRGENSVMYPSIALFGIGLILVSQVSSSWALLLAGGIIGVGFGTLQSSAQTIAVSAVPHHRVGLATATFFTFYDFGIGIGPFILGYLMPLTGFRGLYVAMSVIAFLAIPLYYFVHGKKAKKQAQKQTN